MKSLRSVFLWSVCFLSALLVLGACESSSVVQRPVAVPERLGRVTVAPIAAPDRLLTGRKTTVIVSDAGAGAPILVDFTWNPKDTANLQQGLAASLGGGGGTGCVLHVHLTGAGITDMKLPTCRLAGTLKLTRGGRTLASRPIDITARVMSAVSVAKDKAITQLYGEVSLLLQSVP